MHDRDGLPERTIAALLTDDGTRTWGTSDDPAAHALVTTGEPVGAKGSLTPDGTLQLA